MYYRCIKCGRFAKLEKDPTCDLAQRTVCCQDGFVTTMSKEEVDKTMKETDAISFKIKDALLRFKSRIRWFLR